MRIGSLFAGIGGLELGLERAFATRARVVWQVENDPFCRRVLAKHWPHADRSVCDVRLACAGNLARVDLICGGFPCQDVSSAGKGAGIAEGTRSGLWIEFARILGELRPPIAVVENVASGKRRWLPRVRGDLHLLGYGTSAFALSASDVGAPHLRRRIFVVAYAYGDEVWQQSGWQRRPQGQGTAKPARHGEAGTSPDADSQRELESCGGFAPFWQRAGDGSWRPPVSAIRGMDNGFSGRVDGRLKALGNAVVPQCAEVIGRIIAKDICP